MQIIERDFLGRRWYRLLPESHTLVKDGKGKGFNRQTAPDGVQEYPQATDYYRCVEEYFEAFARIYDEHFSHQYGFWRPYVERVIYRYLDCGNLHNGFVRVKCKDYGHEYLLVFSCKYRYFRLDINEFSCFDSV